MKRFLSLALLLCALCSCKEDAKNITGTSTYYPQFLWVDSKSVAFSKHIDFEFCEDAKNDPNRFVEFQFVDNDGQPVSPEILEIYMNRKKIPNNKFRISSHDTSKQLDFCFTKKAESGKHQGYLRAVNHNLDRIDQEELRQHSQANIMQWTFYFDRQMNPLAKVLMWIGIGIALALAIWFLLLRPALIPHFGNFKKIVLIESNGIRKRQCNVRFKNAKEVIFDSTPHSQSYWNRLFTGKVIVYVIPEIQIPIRFKPKKPKGKNALALGSGYTTSPNPIPQNGIATISHQANKLRLILQ